MTRQWNCHSDDEAYWHEQMQIFYGMASVALWYTPMAIWEELHLLAELAIQRNKMALEKKYGDRETG